MITRHVQSPRPEPSPHLRGGDPRADDSDGASAVKPTYGRLCCLLLVCAATLCARAEPNKLTTAEREAGWQLLFDGHSLANWRGYETAAPGPSWRIVDGALVIAPPRSGDLITVEKFGDFELSIEWRISEAGNGGILYRVGTDARHSYETGPEYQLLDDARSSGRQFPDRRGGALYGLVAPARNVGKPAGEWNQTKIAVRGFRIEHWLNGVKLLDVDLASEEGRALVAGSKFASMPNFARLSSGHIALQDYGNEVCFRNIKIRRLRAVR